MSWLDVLKIGAAALDVGTTVKNEKEFRRSHEGTAAAVSSAIEQAEDQLWSNYGDTIAPLSSDIGAVLEEINA